jgi:hypothetical protein
MDYQRAVVDCGPTNPINSRRVDHHEKRFAVMNEANEHTNTNRIKNLLFMTGSPVKKLIACKK